MVRGISAASPSALCTVHHFFPAYRLLASPISLRPEISLQQRRLRGHVQAQSPRADIEAQTGACEGFAVQIDVDRRRRLDLEPGTGTDRHRIDPKQTTAEQRARVPTASAGAGTMQTSSSPSSIVACGQSSWPPPACRPLPMPAPELSFPIEARPAETPFAE